MKYMILIVLIFSFPDTGIGASGKLRGVVTDSLTGAPIDSAEAILLQGNLVQNVIESNEEGEFYLIGHSAGIYDLKVNARGFHPIIVTDIQIRSMLVTAVYLRLIPDSVKVAETPIKYKESELFKPQPTSIHSEK